jgi:hypothetical protein
MWVPGASARVGATVPSLSSASSDCSTASAPEGIAAPVEIRVAVPGSSVAAATSPAATPPASRSGTPGAVSAARTA